MKSLSEVQIADGYAPGEGVDAVKDIYLPCLSNCNKHKRVTFSFNSSALATLSEGLEALIENDGSLELVIGDTLSFNEERSIKEGEKAKNKGFQDICLARLNLLFQEENLNKDDFKYKLGLLTNLIGSDKLTIKFAFKKERLNPDAYDISKQHTKIAIFEGNNDELVVWGGSSNLSNSGLKDNLEEFSVFKSWDVESGYNRHAPRLLKTWKSLWNDNLEDWKVEEVPGEFYEKWKKRFPKRNEVKKKKRDKIKYQIDPKIWNHKKEAIEIFLEKKKGILAMATGTGKTKTALEVAKILYGNKDINSVIICTGRKNLLDQWTQEIYEWKEKCNFEDLIVNRQYDNHRDIRKFVASNENKIFLISRNAKWLAELFGGLEKAKKEKCLIIHDEIHGLGADSFESNLPKEGGQSDFKYRLGLSATPEREHDEEGTEFIISEIGPVIYTFKLEDAIKKGILCPFNYHPISFWLSEEEQEEKKSEWSKFHASKNSDDPMRPEELYRKLADINKKAESKHQVFREFMEIEENKEKTKQTILFASTTEQGDRSTNVIRKTTSNYKTFYSGEDSTYLERFSAGEIDCLVTCHVISEGIDIQSLKNVILFSSDRALLETTQRIGRCLRTDPNDPDKIANVIDLVLDYDVLSDLNKTNYDDDSIDEKSDWRRATWLTELSKVRKENE
jgi:superfamily II DNA or RNA helicase